MRNRILASVLSFVMILQISPVTAFANSTADTKPSDTKQITNFETLSEDVITQEMMVGSEETPNLPETIKATVTTTTWEEVVTPPASSEGDTTPPASSESATPAPTSEGATTPPASSEGATTPPASSEGATTPPASSEGATTPPSSSEGEKELNVLDTSLKTPSSTATPSASDTVTYKPTTTEEVVEVDVNWVLGGETAFSTEKAGEFIYTAELKDATYTVADSVSLPTITAKVVMPEMQTFSSVQSFIAPRSLAIVGTTATVDTFADLKTALERADIETVILSDTGSKVTEDLPVITSATSLHAGINVEGTKTLTVNGDYNFVQNYNAGTGQGSYDSLIVLNSGDSLTINGGGSLAFSPSINNGQNSVIRVDGGTLTVDGTLEIRGEPVNFSVYGRAITTMSGNSSVTLKNTTLIGVNESTTDTRAQSTLYFGGGGSLTIDNCVVEAIDRSSVTEIGYAMTITDSSLNTEVTNSQFIGYKNGNSGGVSVPASYTFSSQAVRNSGSTTFVGLSDTITITAQPSKWVNGNGVSITAESELGGLTYQWYYNDTDSTSDGTIATGSSAQSASYSASAELGLPAADYYLYCVVSDASGHSVTSNTVLFNIATTVYTYTTEVTPTFWSFGSVNHDYTVAPEAKTITIKNTGTGTITGLNIPAVTGYTITDPVKTSLAKDESTTFTVRPNGSLSSGVYDATLSIEHNTTGETFSIDDVHLQFTVNSATHNVTVSDAQLNFGTKEYGYAEKPAEQTITITNTGTGTIEGLNVTAPTGYEIVSGINPQSIAPSATATFSVRPTSGLATGGYLEYLTISNTSGAVIPSVYLTFRVNPPTLTYTSTVSPSELDFGTVDYGYGEQTAQEVTITNTGTGIITGLTATSISSDFEIVTALSTTTLDPNGGTATFTVRPKTGLDAGSYNNTISINASGVGIDNISLKFVVTQKKAEKPNVGFVAIDHDSGKLTSSDLTGLSYTLNSSSGSTTSVPSGGELTSLNNGDVIRVYRDGDTNHSISEPQIIYVTQANVPSGINKTDATFGVDDGSITGVTSSMQYRKSTDAADNWTDITGTSVTGLSGGTYLVRIKASGLTLASPSVTVTINGYAITWGAEITIGDTKYKLSDNSNNADPTLPTGLSWDHITNTIRMSNYTGTSAISLNNYSGITLHIIGNNTVTVDHTEHQSSHLNSVLSLSGKITADEGANLTITVPTKGDGTANYYYGINSTNLEILGGTIKIINSGGSDANSGIFAETLVVGGDSNLNISVSGSHAYSYGISGSSPTATFSTSGNVDITMEKGAGFGNSINSVTITGEGTYRVAVTKGFETFPSNVIVDTAKYDITTPSTETQDIKQYSFKTPTPTTYTVTYDLDGGSGTAPTQAPLATGAKFNVANYTGTKTNYTFDGWNDGTNDYAVNSEYTMGTSNVTLTAKWVAATPSTLTGTLTIDDTTPQFGQTLNVSYVSGNASGTHTYQWKSGGTNVGTGTSYTVKASDIGKVISVVMTTSDQTGSLTDDTSAVAKADTTAPATPTYGGGTDTTITVSSTETGLEYTRDNGATWQDSKTFTGLTQVTEYNIHARVKETATHNASPMSGVLTVTTKYTVYNVTFNSQGGTPVGVKQTVNWEVYEPTAPTKANHNLEGWFTSATGGTKVTFPYTVKNNTTTLYAQWTENKIISISITPTSATVELGATQDFDATVSGTGIVSQDVTWSIVETSRHTGTTIDANGLLTVHADETLTSLTVKATSTQDTTISKTVTVLLDDPTKTDQILSFAPTGITATVGDTTVTEPTLSGDMTTVTYSSVNTKVATVNSTSGEVTIVGAGTAVITANAMADATYNAATASYTITVNAGTITAGSDETTVFEGEFAQLESVKITVGGTTTTLTQVGNKLTGYTGYTFNGGVVGEVNPGSIAVTLYKEFLATLPAGGYTLEITLTGGVSAGTVTATIPAKTQHDVEITEVGVGGTATVNNQDLGTIVSLNAGTKDGYTFSSWTTTGSITIDSYSSANTSFVVLGDATIKANWTKNSSPSTGGTSSDKYNLVVNYGSGDGNYESGTWITIKAENRYGYTFSHWSSEEVTFENAKAETTRFIMNSKNVEVTAVYVLNDGTLVLTPEDETEETAKPDDSKEETAPVETEKPVETEPPVLGGDSENEPTSADGGSSMLPILGIGAVIAAIAAFLVSKKRKSE